MIWQMNLFSCVPVQYFFKSFVWRYGLVKNRKQCRKKVLNIFTIIKIILAELSRISEKHNEQDLRIRYIKNNLIALPRKFDSRRKQIWYHFREIWIYTVFRTVSIWIILKLWTATRLLQCALMYMFDFLLCEFRTMSFSGAQAPVVTIVRGEKP